MASRSSRALVLACVLCFVGCAGAPRPQSSAGPPSAGDAHRDDLHPIIYAYRESLRPFLAPEEVAALDEVDWDRTARGDAERLRFLAADRAIRRILPLILEAEASPALEAHAARLRALPPLLNRDTDVVAHIAVTEAVAALRRVRRGEAALPPIPIDGAGTGGTTGSASDASGSAAEGDDPAAPAIDPMASLPRARSSVEDPEGEGDLAEALAEYAVEYSRVHGVSAMHGAAAAAAAADAMDVAFLIGGALERPETRQRVLDEALSIARDLCDAARRRERLPRIPQQQTAPTDD
jgi:hypothetical protein